MRNKLTERSEWSEKALEQRLKAAVEELGGCCLKYSNTADTGWPDRVCLFPGGETLWVELKSTGKKPTRLQEKRIADLQSIGHNACWIDSPEKLRKVLRPYRYHVIPVRRKAISD